MIPTPQQQAIYDAIAAGGPHVMVRALAGTGKTSTAIGCLNQPIPGRVGFVAFNRHIAEELQSRLPSSVRACTLHSLGFAAVRRAYRGVTVDEQKLRKLADKHKPAGMGYQDAIVAQDLARLCKYTLGNSFDHTVLDELADHFGLELPADPSNVYLLTDLLIAHSATETATVDFDDMVWLPHRNRLPVENYELLAVDEAQDLNRCQQELALQAVNGGRLVPIGDPRQAIYGFSGSDCNAMDGLSRQLHFGYWYGCKRLPLTVTFRCPISHVRLAQALVPEIEYAPQAIEGTIRTTCIKGIGKKCAPGDLIIGRKNAPLVSLTYKLVLAGVRATMRGRDIGKGLLALIERLEPTDLDDLITKLGQYRAHEERRLIDRGASAAAIESLEDKCDCLGQLAAQAVNLDALQRFISSVFDDQAKVGPQVVLSSVHRAKGLEADRVFVLDPKSLPLIRRDSKSWEIQQEKNICYIAATRAKKELVFQDAIPAIFGKQPCANASSSPVEV